MFKVLDKQIEELKKKYLCAKCGYTGFLVKKENNTINAPENCGCVAKYQEAYNLLAANIPKTYREISLDIVEEEFKERNKNDISKILTYNEKIAGAVEKGIGLFIYGPPGAGKSFWGSIVLKVALKNGFSAYFAYIEDLITAAFQATKNERAQNEFKTFITTIDLLLIDDIDRLDIDRAPAALSLLASLFKARYYEGKPLIATGNISKEEFVNECTMFRSIFDERMMDVYLEGDHRPKILKSLEDEFFNG